MNVLKIVLIIIGVILIICICMIPFDMVQQKKLKNMVIKEVDLNTYNDGEYVGEFKLHRWQYTVKVNIKEQKITNIEIADKTLQNKYSQKVIAKVIEEQKVNIDTVSGATISDKALLKAIENALD